MLFLIELLIHVAVQLFRRFFMLGAVTFEREPESAGSNTDCGAPPPESLI